MSKHKADTSIRVEQREKIKEILDIRPFPWTEKQKQFIELALKKENKIIFCKGVAGTSKTILSVYCSLLLLNEKRIGEIFMVRNPIESSSHSIGFLPGTGVEKTLPYFQPIYDKLNELLSKNDISKLIKEERFKGIPLGFMRGLSIRNSSIICEESQNLTVQDLLLVMSRLGKYSKLFIIGDTQQSDIKHSGFSRVFDVFNNDESREKGIVTFEFDKSDIMRNEILSYIIEKFENIK